MGYLSLVINGLLMVKVICAYSGCGDRRQHWERPYEKREPVEFEVPEDRAKGPCYCSIECYEYARAKGEWHELPPPKLLL